MVIKPTTEFINYQTPSNPINPIVDTGGYRGDPVTDWYKKIVDDKILDKIKDKIKDNYTDWYSQYTGNDNGGGDNGGYVDNPIAVQQPEEQVAETPVVEATTPTVEKTAAETEVTNPIAETETAAETEKETEPAADIATQDVDQRNDAFINNAVGSQGADSNEGTSANDAWDKKLKELYGEDYETVGTTSPVSGQLADNGNSGTPYAAGLNTNIQTPDGYSPEAGVDAFGNAVVEAGKGIGNTIGSVYRNAIDLPVSNALATYGIGSWTNVRGGFDANGTFARIVSVDGQPIPFIWNSTLGEWVQAGVDKSSGTYVPLEKSTVGSNVGQYQGDWAKAYEVGLLRGNPTGATTGATTGQVITHTPKATPATADNPINNKDAQVADNHALRGFDANESNTPYTTDVGTKGNPISDVQVGDTAIHYVDKEGAVHSVPLSTEEGQAVVDNYFDIDPTEVTVGDTTVSYFDENGDYHVIPLASEKGQEIQKYVDAMGDYGSIEANYAKAIEAIGEYNANNNYLTVGTTDNPINADELINTIADLKVNPTYAGWTDEQIRAEAVRIIQARFDQTNGKPFSWSEDLPLIEGVPFYNTETGTGNALYDSIMNDGRTVSGFSSQEDITYQDSILHYFDNPEYSNGGGLPTENGAGFRGVVIPESCQDIVATSKYGALDARNGDKIETVVMSDEKYTEAVLDFIEANPQIEAMLEAGKLTLDGIIAHFFKLNTAKPSGGSSYRGYGGYYRGGGGGGYRSYGGSSGGSSNSAGSTTQNQQRVYNIMKNWSF